MRAHNEGLSLRGALAAAVKEANTHHADAFFTYQKIEDLDFHREKLHTRIQQSLQRRKVITIGRPVFPGCDNFAEKYPQSQ